MKAFLIILLSTSFFACDEPESYTTLRDKNMRKLTGKRITIVGKALHLKIGPVVQTQDDVNIFIEDHESWPEDYYVPEDNAKLVRVTGKLVVKKDLPVFIQKEGEPVQQGIPVPEGTNLEEAQKRYVLRNATWELVEK